MNEPMGRLGSCRPARERRTALAMAVDGLVLADDALVQALLEVQQPRLLALEHLVDGMPVHFETTAAMSSSVTSSRRNEPCFCASLSSAFFVAAGLLELGHAPKRSSAARFRSPRALRQLGLGLGGLDRPP